MTDTALPVLNRKDFVSDQEVRWCPGCGDYSILAQTQKVMPDFGYPRENIVFISGIGCSGRLPYYMNTYGFHSIHGRAPTLATGLKAARPELMVWVITGDGDALSIGGNHVLHSMRRNVDIKLIMFNNRIYGLTKGQASPTSEFGKRTKSTPQGTIDQPIVPLSVAITAEATFVARSVDTHTEHLQETLTAAGFHHGSAFVEVLQNCNIFNDGAWRSFTDREVRDDMMLVLKHGEPIDLRQGPRQGHPAGWSAAAGGAAGQGRQRVGPAGPRRDRRRPHPGLRPVAHVGARSSRCRWVSSGASSAPPTTSWCRARSTMRWLATAAATCASCSTAARPGSPPRQPMICPVCGFDNLQGSDECDNCGADLRTADVPQPGSLLEDRLVSDQLDDVRRREPIFVSRDTPLRIAVRTMQDEHVTCLLVGEGRRLDGILTERNLLMRAAGRDLDGVKVGEVMTPQPVTLQDHDTVAVAIHTMAQGSFRHVPLVEDGRVVGIVTAQDLFRHILRILG